MVMLACGAARWVAKAADDDNDKNWCAQSLFDYSRRTSLFASTTPTAGALSTIVLYRRVYDKN